MDATDRTVSKTRVDINNPRMEVEQHTVLDAVETAGFLDQTLSIF